MRTMIKIFLLSFFAFSLFSCSSSKSVKNTDVDNLERAAMTEQEQKDRQEILSLLGITDEEQVPDDEEKKDMQGKIENMESTISQMNKELNQLKAELLTKDQKIADLESKEQKEPVKELKPQPVQVSDDFVAEYKNALNLFMSKKYLNSLNLFSTLLEKNRTHSLSDNCQYWIGECYYQLKQYNQAIIAFEKVFTFPSSNKDDDSQIKLGKTYIMLGQKQKAKEEFNRLINKFPKSEYIRMAKSYLNKL